MPTLRLWEIEVRFHRPLRTPAGLTITSRRSILVQVDTGAGAGWGEAPAFPSGRFGTADEAWESLTARWSQGLPGVPIAAAAFQAARADAAARAAGVPLHTSLGGEGRAVLARHPIGILEPSDVEGQAVWLDAHGIRAVKVKVAPGHDVDPISHLRRSLPGLDIGVDANGTYDDPHDPTFGRLADLGVSFVEQPLPAADIAGLATLRNRLVISVCLDETLDEATRAHEAITTGAADQISVKVNRHGLERLSCLGALAREAGVSLRIGGTYDTAIGRRHVLAAACLPGVVDAEVGPPAAYLTTDVASYPGLADGLVTPDEMPGIGVEPDEDALERVALRWAEIEV